MKWAVLLGSPAISGGTYVIFEHATRNKTDDVYVVTENPVSKEDVAWHEGAGSLKFITYEEASKMFFDAAIATWWRTVYELSRIKASNYIYFVQSIESRFYPNQEVAVRWLSEATYLLPLNIITEAEWIKKYLEVNYHRDVILVRNGIRKDIYKAEGASYKRTKGLRVLVEGPVDVSFKNVPKTVELVNKSQADEIWLLTSSDIKTFSGIDRVFSRIPINEVAKIYRSCDVIVKLSYVEGMFGPPLEMFHCGGTSIVYDVTGYDEYVKDNYNSIVVNTDHEKDVVSAINRLKNNSKLLRRLKLNALKTANEWIGWDRSSSEFRDAVKNILQKNNSISQQQLKNETGHLFAAYDLYNTKQISLKHEIKKRLRSLAGKIYRLFWGR